MTLLSIRSLGVAAVWLVAAAFAAGPVQAQQGTVAGRVTDKSNQQAVAGAAVLVVGTSLQARTGREGRFMGALFAVLALAVAVRISAVAAGLVKLPEIGALLPWLPASAWLTAALLLLGARVSSRRG